jgi:RHS repeat-associated protein
MSPNRTNIMATGISVCLGVLTLFSIDGFSQEYQYDSNGNLSKDTNKQIRSVHYNYLNLADTIVYNDGRKIIYMYTASGEKLQEKVIAANGAIVKKADYINEFLYNRDTLRQIRHGYGRGVPLNVGDKNSAWEYQYEQKDQVGNVRALLTSRPDANSDKGTFETANMNAEQNRFQRYENVRRINSVLFDHTNKGATHYSERLNGSSNEKYGLAKSLSVMPGDVINLEVYAKYMDPDASHWTAALLPLVTQIANGTAVAGTVMDGSGYAAGGSAPFALAGLNGTTRSSGSGPKAYLNWLVFDRNFVFRNGGYVQMKGEGKENGTNVAHEKLSTQIRIGEAGYVYVYLSNEEATPLDVFFDDFSVELVKGPVIQQTDYDPFGLVTDESSREHSVQNDFLYNGKELQKDFDLNWYDYGARMYDAALGRWHVIDPMAEKYSNWSPYNYVLNNPLKFTDTDGRDAKVITPVPRKVTGIIKKMPSGIGERIVAAVENNHTIEVIIAYEPAGKFTMTPRRVLPLGRTQESLSPDYMHTDPNTGKITITKIPGFPEFDIFAGQDITDDVWAGREVYLVAVALTDPARMTEATLHELAAHANPDQAAVTTEMNKCHCSREEAEHTLYGSAYVANYLDTKDITVSRHRRKVSQHYMYPQSTGLTDGSTADQIQIDITRALNELIAERIKAERARRENDRNENK